MCCKININIHMTWLQGCKEINFNLVTENSGRHQSSIFCEQCSILITKLQAPNWQLIFGRHLDDLSNDKGITNFDKNKNFRPSLPFSLLMNVSNWIQALFSWFSWRIFFISLCTLDCES